MMLPTTKLYTTCTSCKSKSAQTDNQQSFGNLFSKLYPKLLPHMKTNERGCISGYLEECKRMKFYKRMIVFVLITYYVHSVPHKTLGVQPYQIYSL